MSIWAVSWALRVRGLSRTDKLALVALADYADDQDEAWPHVETLAEVLDASQRTVFRALEALEAKGLISRQRGFVKTSGGGLRQVNSVYRLHVPDTVTRRAGRGSARPQELRESTAVLHGDVDATPEVPVDETPCDGRHDTGVTSQPGRGEMPSRLRHDTGVTPGLWGDTGVSSGVTPMSPLYKEEPSLEPPGLSPLPPAAPGSSGVGSGSVGSGDVDSGGGGCVLGGAPPPDDRPTALPGAAVSSEDWALMRRCLPDEMQALDALGVAVVVPLLRERLAAGWPPGELRRVLAASPLPDRVRHLAGLVAHRLGLISVDGAPAPSVARVRHELPPRRQRRPRWLREQQRARIRGDARADLPLEWWQERYPEDDLVKAE